MPAGADRLLFCIRGEDIDGVRYILILSQDPGISEASSAPDRNPFEIFIAYGRNEG